MKHELKGKPNLTIHARNSVVVHHAHNTVYGLFKLNHKDAGERFAVVDLHSDLLPIKGEKVPSECEYHEVMHDSVNAKTIVQEYGIEDEDWLAAYEAMGIDWDKYTRRVIGEA